METKEIPEQSRDGTQKKQRKKNNDRFGPVFRNVLISLTAAIVIAVLVPMLWMPILRVYGTSMTPTINDGDILITFKSSKLKQNDVVAFDHNGKLLIKRVIAGPGDTVNIDENGTVSVNDEVLNEPYLKDKEKGTCNIEFPFTVPEDQYFVLSDQRSNSADSRNTAVGCITGGQVLGKIRFCCWPLSSFGIVD